MTASRPLILIVGLQKSGTTLLARLLRQTGVCDSPFFYEGDDFWGNVPAFSPRAYPAGAIYQRAGGDDGHEIAADDATEDVARTLQRRLASLKSAAPVILNKNPYNVVRLRWLRALFPSACIVAVVRAPVPNVYSLLKKFLPHDGRGLAPEDGWWGVKPRGWRAMVDDDKVRQCAHQWEIVTRRLAADAECVDLVIDYRDLCAEPRLWVERILTAATGQPAHIENVFPVLRCWDDEFTRGSRLLSKNRENGLAPPPDEVIEMPPLDAASVAAIRDICSQADVALAPWRRH